MKMKEQHIVPLAHQAVAILRELHGLTGWGEYVFPSLLTLERPMSNNTVNTALRRLGHTKKQMTGHGFEAWPERCSMTRGFTQISQSCSWLTRKDKIRAAYNKA